MSVDHSLMYKAKGLKNIAHQLRLKAIIKEIKKNAGNRQIVSYADIGCSNGFVTNIIATMLEPNTIVGLDCKQKHLTKGKNDYPYIKFCNFNLNVLGAANEEYDLVTCFETLEHVGKISNALANILKSCKRNGLIIITVPIEIGVVGYLKYIVKTRIYGYKLDELGIQDTKHYERDLLNNNDISKYRCEKKGSYGTHFGFDYRIIDQYLKSRHIEYKAKNKLFTRFYFIHM